MNLGQQAALFNTQIRRLETIGRDIGEADLVTSVPAFQPADFSAAERAVAVKQDLDLPIRGGSSNCISRSSHGSNPSKPFKTFTEASSS
jgi:hypothetical protein